MTDLLETDHAGHEITEVPYYPGPGVMRPCGTPVPKSDLEVVEYCVDCDEVLTDD